MARTKDPGRKRLTLLSGARPAQCLDRPRAWNSKDAAAAAKDFFSRPRRTAIRDLIRELCSEDPFDHRCAAELARLVSQREPGILAAYADLLAEVAATFPMEEWQARGYVIVAAAHNAMTHAQRERLLPLVRARLAEDRIAVRAMALEAFALLALREPCLCDEAMELIEAARYDPAPALRCRARLVLPALIKATLRCAPCNYTTNNRKTRP